MRHLTSWTTGFLGLLVDIVGLDGPQLVSHSNKPPTVGGRGPTCSPQPPSYECVCVCACMHILLSFCSSREPWLIHIVCQVSLSKFRIPMGCIHLQMWVSTRCKLARKHADASISCVTDQKWRGRGSLVWWWTSSWLGWYLCKSTHLMKLHNTVHAQIMACKTEENQWALGTLPKWISWSPLGDSKVETQNFPLCFLFIYLFFHNYQQDYKIFHIKNN